ncbi:putative RNA pseudouridine synthase [Bdellovibrio bacteriovorus]|uniref:RluA family pseudouridine synthase n=1 Tax=Bdellovibrio bacteriovorus TaxID=959 RepID=UPI00045BFD91|nr:RNA pseudouridine synthase [Bdellovibrio bacteriovorus]AHZ85311.1 pseudouridylate synthase [Bdellovibrio bacteriovorus]BEV69205.1 putative RNA pseudouridine synthase [Bdellovibrio bacteriovorus]
MKKIPKKHQPRGFEILHEDLDVIVGNKAAGVLTVAAKWDRDNTVHNLLNLYVRKGNPRSNKCVYVVHRLDQATTGVLIFAKTEQVQQFLKDDWKSTIKTYYAIVHGKMPKKSGTITSYLEEDENYVVHSSKDSDKGKLAITEYEVLKETEKFSLLKINLLTGKKNQIRVHLAGEGHPIVGDPKYGKPTTNLKELRLHSASLEFTHPHSKKRITIKAPVPNYFRTLIDYEY